MAHGLNHKLSFEEEQFFKLVHKAYFVDGKYYLSGCHAQFKGLEKQIKLNDTISTASGFNSSISFIVKELNRDSIEFETISFSVGCLVMPGESSPPVSISKLKPFKIKCQNQREVINNGYYSDINQEIKIGKKEYEKIEKLVIALLKTTKGNCWKESYISYQNCGQD